MRRSTKPLTMLAPALACVFCGTEDGSGQQQEPDEPLLRCLVEEDLLDDGHVDRTYRYSYDESGFLVRVDKENDVRLPEPWLVQPFGDPGPDDSCTQSPGLETFDNDAQGRPVHIHRNPAHYVCDDVSHVPHVEDTYIAYEEDGSRVRHETDVDADGVIDGVEDYEYREDGRLVRYYRWIPPDDAGGRETLYTYDAEGRLIREEEMEFPQRDWSRGTVFEYEYPAPDLQVRRLLALPSGRVLGLTHVTQSAAGEPLLEVDYDAETGSIEERRIWTYRDGVAIEQRRETFDCQTPCPGPILPEPTRVDLTRTTWSESCGESSGEREDDGS